MRVHDSGQHTRQRTPSAIRRAATLALFTLAILIASTASWGSPLPPSWYQVNQSGFVSGQGPTTDGTSLFVFADQLFAFNQFGLFRMADPVARTWSPIVPPSPPTGPGAVPGSLMVLGDSLYAWSASQLWWIGEGGDLEGSDWHLVTSTGLPAGVSPVPKTIFGGRIYAVYDTGAGAFEIWRTADVGVDAATWQRVVANSFGDPTNNQSVDVMIEFNGHVYAGTQTLGGMFGDPRFYGTGVEIWESASGDSGTWSQVNTDGFGTTFPGCINPGTPNEVCDFAIHQVVGSAAVYRAAGQAEDYLYVGTKSHYGAEIWRYDGTGSSGWSNVTPSWAGPCQIGCGPGRNDDLVVFQGRLMLAEGYPTANLAQYDGASWSVVVDGPNPFDVENQVLAALAVRDGKLYVTAGGQIASHGDQVWGYPFTPPVAACRSATVPTAPGTCFAEASVDDGSFDPDGGLVSLAQLPAGPYSAGTRNVTLTVTDPDGQTASCVAPVTVEDVESPTLSITAPVNASCHTGPVTVTDLSNDNCTSPLPHSYVPPGGPTYSAPGWYDVQVTVRDDAGRTDSDGVTFAVDPSAPAVTILVPAHDQTGLPPVTIPIAIVFAVDDGSAGTGVAHEVLKLEGCVVEDGDVSGDRDGLLSDERIQLTKYSLCQIMARCGFTTLNLPKIRIEATDLCDNTGATERIIRKRLLKTEVCARP